MLEQNKYKQLENFEILKKLEELEERIINLELQVKRNSSIIAPFKRIGPVKPKIEIPIFTEEKTKEIKDLLKNLKIKE